ncbi:helix-turn-helix domain-containing protein [Sulfurivirga sp.]|uniref:helix-turn-helix domain-containing protein n=1 Tax=Sulfurivirga sp. TaxID=2614236 RepID=UPI0025DAFA70|nr:helix-turn-helix domain-containing protein [Sulfurivirga sp.]
MGKTVRIRLEGHQPVGRIDSERVDATSEIDIARQMAEDERAAREDAARYARHVRHKLGLSQQAFARCIHVSVETVRNWEQGKRSPTGAAQALLRVLDRAPQAALEALKGS